MKKKSHWIIFWTTLGILFTATMAMYRINDIFIFIDWRNVSKNISGQAIPFEVVDQARARSVILEASDTGHGKRRSMGSGVLIDSVHILTAKHYVERYGGPLQIQAIYQGHVFSVKRVDHPLLKDIDVALLEIVDYQFSIPGITLTDSVFIDMSIFGFNSATFKGKDIFYTGFVTGKENLQPSRQLKRFILKDRLLPSERLLPPYKGYYLITKNLKFVVPGMSGSGIYDWHGRLAGILVGRPNPYPFKFERKGVVVPIAHFENIFNK